jgi:hypothetical protein
MTTVYTSHQDRVEFLELLEATKRQRNARATKICEFRKEFAKMGMHFSRSFLSCKAIPKAPAKLSFSEAWETLRYLENWGVDLSGLPCGADDARYETAVGHKARAQAIVREFGRPLP